MLPSGVLRSTELPHPQIETPPIPISDIDIGLSKYSKNEIRLRNQLASLYRLVDKFHWSQSIYNHMTVRVPTEDNSHEILINPFGMSYHEITASSLVKVNLEGRVIDQGSTGYAINQAGYVLHSALHEGRPEIQAIVHLHTPAVAAVSAMKCGFLPVCQESMIIGPVAYHEYQGILVDEEEKTTLVADLSNKNVMILKNHGFVVCGRTIEEAFVIVYHLILACETQIRALSCGGLDYIHLPSPVAQERALNTARHGGGGVNREHDGVDHDRWRVGELEWEAWMRMLDSSGLKTGYEYKNSKRI